MSKLELLNNIPGVEDLTNENAETVSGGYRLSYRRSRRPSLVQVLRKQRRKRERTLRNGINLLARLNR